jgi:hypothetical protein
LAKARHVVAAKKAVGVPARCYLLLNTTFLIRAFLALLAVLAAVVVQWAGYLAAGIPAIVLAAALFLFKRENIPLRPHAGGAWRQMTPEDIKQYEKSSTQYHRSRTSFFDITCQKGVAGFSVFVSVVTFALVFLPNDRPELTWAAVIDSVILAVPTWFGTVRAELPVSILLEGFSILSKWEKSLSKLIGRKTPGNTPKFFVREDDLGAIEIRLRATPNIDGIKNIEVAGEVFKTGTLHRNRTVFVLRLVPGSEAARKIAVCRSVAEHHLTPDLQEEIIVLRNRRGKRASGITPLKSALAGIKG